MKLSHIQSIDFPRKELAIDKYDYEGERKEYIFGRVNNGEFFFLSNIYGICQFSSTGELVSSIKITKAIKPNIQEFLTDSTYLIHSYQGLITGQWKKGSATPEKYMRLDSGMWPFSVQIDKRKNAVLAFPGTYYTFRHEYLSDQDSMDVLFLIDMSDNPETNGTIIKRIKIPKKHIGIPVFGRRLDDGRTFVLVSSSSELLEFNREYEYIFSIGPIMGYKQSLPYQESSDSADCFSLDYPLPLFSRKFLLALRNPFTVRGQLDVWNIESRRYEGSVDTGDERFLLDADDQYVYLVESITKDWVTVGFYTLEIERDVNDYISMLALKDPYTGEDYTLGSVLPDYGEELMMIFTKPEDCNARSYIFDRQGYYFDIDEGLPNAMICYTDEDPVVVSSFINSSRQKFWVCGNTDAARTMNLPYAVIIDKHTKIVKTLTDEEVAAMLKKF